MKIKIGDLCLCRKDPFAGKYVCRFCLKNHCSSIILIIDVKEDPVRSTRYIVFPTCKHKLKFEKIHEHEQTIAGVISST